MDPAVSSEATGYILSYRDSPFVSWKWCVSNAYKGDDSEP